MHLEEEDGGNDEVQESDDPNGIKRVTEEFMVCLARAAKDFQGKETVKWQGGDGINEGSPDPSDNNQCHKESPDRGS